MQGSHHLIVFARPPIAGTVKTRLARTIGPERAATLYAAFLKDTLTAFESLDVERAIWWHTEEDLPSRTGWQSHRQIGGDLGERMEAATRVAFASGARAVAIIGSDSPTLPPSRVLAAFEALSATDVVLGPTLDGGYYLIGLSRPTPEVFESIPWSTGKVLERSIEQTQAANRSIQILEPWFDIDEHDDLLRLAAELRVDPDRAPATAATLDPAPS